MTPEVGARACALLGGEPAEWTRVENRIASPNERRLIRLADGRSAFAKAGFFACRAGLPSPDRGPHLRPLQRGRLEVGLPWDARESSLPAPS